MTGGPLRFRLARHGAAETLYVSGELDIATARALECRVAGVMDGQGGEFRLDLSAMTFMDSNGASALLRMHNRIESLGRRLVIASPSRSVGRVLELMGLDQVLDVQR
jgi:anti-sigma B factor antagonist